MSSARAVLAVHEPATLGPALTTEASGTLATEEASGGRELPHEPPLFDPEELDPQDDEDARPGLVESEPEWEGDNDD